MTEIYEDYEWEYVSGSEEESSDYEYENGLQDFSLLTSRSVSTTSSKASSRFTSESCFCSSDLCVCLDDVNTVFAKPLKINKRSPYNNEPTEIKLSEATKHSTKILRTFLDEMRDKNQSFSTPKIEDCILNGGLNNPKHWIIEELCTKSKPSWIEENNISYIDGSYYEGDMQNGTKHGEGSFWSKNNIRFDGYFVNDCPEGLFYSENEHNSEEWAFFYIKNEKLYGQFKELRGKNVKYGIWNGPFWTILHHGAVLYGQLDSTGKMSGYGVYLYPNLWLAIYGQFQNDRFIQGGEGVLVDIVHDNYGFLKPIIQPLQNQSLVEFEAPSRLSLGKNLQSQDMLENIQVFVNESNVPGAGEGLFAKVDIKQNQIVCFFNGIRQRKCLRSAFQEQEITKFSEYRICLSKDISLDIPDEYISIKKYKATLGHKVCHSFQPNVIFSETHHPRFGEIICLVAQRDLCKGEEIFVNYGYEIQNAPEWYQNLWSLHLKSQFGWSTHDILKYGYSVHSCTAAFESANANIQARNNKLLDEKLVS